MSQRLGPGGSDRRRYRAFRTFNSEYHCLDDLCVAVRDVRSGEFDSHHPAVGMHITGGIRLTPDGSVASYSSAGEIPHLGECLFFGGDSPDFGVRTSALQSIDRPPKLALATYRH